MEQPRDAYSLSDIKQRSGESLQQYLTRFNAAVAAVQNADEKLTLMALCGGIHPDSKLARRLTKEKPLTLQDFFHEAGKYTRLEDAAAHRHDGSTEGSDVNGKSANPPTRAEGSKSGNSEKDNSRANPKTDKSSKRRFRPGARFESYTPLNDTVENIYLATQ